MHRSAARFLVVASLLVAGSAGMRAANTLAPSSPFLPPTTTGAPVGENNPLELRGILVDDGGYRFSIFNPTRHAGTWARLNESGHDFVIRAHDVARDMITVDYQGRVLTLPLRASKVVVIAPPVPSVVQNPGAGPQIQPGPSGPPPNVVLNPTPADEIARFNRVKEEIARRRAAREQSPANHPGLRK